MIQQNISEDLPSDLNKPQNEQPIQSQQQEHNNQGSAPVIDNYFLKLKQLLQNQQFVQGITFKEIKKHLLFNTDPKCLTIMGYILQNIENANQLQQVYKNTSKGVCSNPILENQQTYICQDCGRQTQYHIYCGSCFESSFEQGKHLGHRFKAQTGRSGCCDCGDPDSLETNGFCSTHCGQIKSQYKFSAEIQQRIKELIFYYCDEHTSHMRLFDSEGYGQDQSLLQIQSIEMFLFNILSNLSYLIVYYCKDKLPLRIFIGQLMLKPFNKKSYHYCQSDKFQETFAKRKQHICQDSVVKLLFKYSISLNKFEKQITEIFYSLSVNPVFKAQLSNTFLKCLNYILITYNNHQTLPVVTIFHIYFVYCQFLCGNKTDVFINHPKFNIIKEKTKFMINLVNTKYYGEFNNTITLFGIYQRIQQVVFAEKRQNVAFQMLEHFIELAPYTSEERGRKFDHHRFKTLMLNHLLNVFINYISVIKYNDEQSKYQMQKMIKRYFQRLGGEVIEEIILQNPEQIVNQKQKQIDHESDWESYDSNEEEVQAAPVEPPKVIKIQLKEDDPRGEIKFGWYCLPELLTGTLIASYYHYQGKQALGELLQPARQSGHLSQYIKKLVNSLSDAYTLGRSKQVGFPNEYPPKDLFKYFYKYPTRMPFDTIISILQILAIVVPNQLLNELQHIQPSLLIEILSDILIEQSPFVNLCTRCQFTNNKMAKNSLKIQIINILNLKNKINFSDMKKLFLQEMFNGKVSFKQIISEVAILDSKTQLYTTKQNYKNLQETILVKRAETIYGNFFEGQESTLKLIQKGSLFKKQKEQGWNTLASVATQSLGKTEKIMNIIQIILNHLWKAEESVNNYTEIELMYVILLRNDIKFCSEREAQTGPQKLVDQMLLKLTKESVQVNQNKKESPTKSNNKMKMHLEKLRKQQQQFIENNPNLFKQIQEDKQNQTANQQNICLICQQGRIDNQYPVFLISSQFQIIQQLKLTTYMSCGHLFHTKCLQKYAAGLCPVCKHLYQNTFPIIPQKQITMLNPYVSNQISCTLNQDLFRFNKGDPPALRILDMIFSKIYFATLESCSKFVNKDLKQLRSVFCNYVLRKDKRQNFANIENILAKLTSRGESFMAHKEDRQVLFNLIYRLISLPFYMDSLKVKQMFDAAVSTQYTFLFADLFFKFIDHQNKDYEMQIKLHEQALNGRMTEFCKPVVYTYALLFDDPRNQILNKIDDQSKAGEILTKQYPQFFNIDKQVFNKYINLYIDDKKYIEKIPESIIPAPYVIPMPQNYMEFHKTHYDLLCDQCSSITQFYNNQLWLCLLCGYRSCLVNCPKLNDQLGFLPSQSVYAHCNNNHFGSSISIQMNSGLIGIIQSSAILQYGYLYENAFGEHDNRVEKKWEQLKIQTNRWSKLMDLLKKRAMRIYAVQQNLKGRVFNPDMES